MTEFPPQQNWMEENHSLFDESDRLYWGDFRVSTFGRKNIIFLFLSLRICLPPQC
jgi:hypothetical protein